MEKEIKYLYLGTNGTILSPVHLEDAYYVRYVTMRADEGMVLTKNNKNFVKTATIPEENLYLWQEVPDQNNYNIDK